MNALQTFAVRLVAIAAISSVCEQFLGFGRAEKGVSAIAGLLAVGAMVDFLAALAG